MREWLHHYNPSQPPPPPRPADHYEAKRAALYARLRKKQAQRLADAALAPSTPSPIRSSEYYARKRAQLYARLAEKHAHRLRIADLNARRHRAIVTSARQWPRARSHPQHPENIAWQLARRRELDARIAEETARRVAEEQERCAAVEARGAHLVALRHANRRNASTHRL
ncbi:hypothetical protein R3P38DRAFT_3177210 [Favolaschia claudopus]|uniref:Uncharacterized protein n=1 Tax=Favolaschia claudopus TaxID=2862362 RepID=A0AAW0D0R9_9AGAR